MGCEESQVVCIAFRMLGHEAYSCDLQECSGGHPEWHITGDVVKVLYAHRWDLIIAHPPCTYFANSGVRWLFKDNGKKDPIRWEKLMASLRFWNEFIKYKDFTGVRMALENPIPHKYAVKGFPELGAHLNGIGEYTQVVQPWMFGHGEQKATCLWLYNLPKLQWYNQDTLFGRKTSVEGREQNLWRLPPTPDRAKLRSKTFTGIARAMAEQWGGKVNVESISGR